MDYFPFSDLIGVFGTCQSINLIRCAEGTWTKGKYAAGARTVSPLSSVSVQTLQQGQYEDMMPEGARRHEARVMYTQEKLLTTEECFDPNTTADRIEFDDSTYEIKSRKNLIDYYEYMMVRISEDRL